MLRYPGLIPSNVSKDAKYSVVSRSGGGYEIRLVYRVSARERELLTTDRHEPLVDMVNEVKVAQHGQAGGAFYINEFKDVLVPTLTGECFFAGQYEKLLKFEYDDGEIGPQPPANLKPGDPWPGPHVGIRYTLAAGGNDIKYERKEGRRSIQHRLSDTAGDGPAAALARRLRQIKGEAGGRIYINEVSEFFSPMAGDSGVDYIYLGGLDEELWFPAPDVPRP